MCSAAMHLWPNSFPILVLRLQVEHILAAGFVAGSLLLGQPAIAAQTNVADEV